jgi:hypothetical protein
MRFQTVLQLRPQAVTLGSGDGGCVETRLEAGSGMGADKVSATQSFCGVPIGTVVLFQASVLPVEPLHLRPHPFLLEL